MSKPSASRPANRDEFEIAIVCALPLEYNAVAILLDQCWDTEEKPYKRANGDYNTYTNGSMGGFNVVILLLPGTGKVEAAGSAASLRSSYPYIKLVFLNGICGGVPFVKGGELLLGDVVISKTVVQYDLGNRYPDAFKPKDTIDGRLSRASKDVRSFTAILETDRGGDRLEKRAACLLDVIQRASEERDSRRRKTAIYAYPGSSNDKLFEASYCHKHRTSSTCGCSDHHQDQDLVCEASRQLTCDQLGCDHARLVPRTRLQEKQQSEKDGDIKDAQAPSIFIGRVGSGDTVLKSGIDRDRLAREHGILAFETEGSGIWDEFPCIIVKGVCDYADSHNNKEWQNFAAATAASVVKGLIEHYPKTDQRVAALVKDPVSTHIQDSRENRECLRDLRSTDPADDKKRIQMTKGGLLRDSYAWILTNSAFLKWRNDPKCPLLWIRGNPGKGKTMLLCGIVDEMEKSAAYNLSYFFCQQTDTRINNSVAILRGLIYMLVRKQPSLMPHIRTKYDDVGKTVFEDQNAWVALSQILANILQDPTLKDTILIIDALDECSQGLHQLLDLIIEILPSSLRLKLLVSSRNELDIQKRLEDAENTSSVSLELNSTSVAAAVASYIRHKVRELKIDDDTQAEVEQYLIKHANGTFLWVALVCDSLKRVPRFQMRSVLDEFPPGLDHLYERMMKKICDVNARGLGRQILAIALAAYRPLTILELASLVEFIPGKVGDNDALCEISELIPGLCGSFLVQQDQIVYFVHQSAKDYLVNKAPDELFLPRKTHYQILSASLSNMTMILKKDIYGLEDPGYSIHKVPAMDPDPLAAVRYSCVYWIDHFLDSLPQEDFGTKAVEDFLRSKYLYWLEALALLRNVPKGAVNLQKLEKQVRKTQLANSIKDLVKDASRFIQEFADAIHEAPLQTYVSALLFSPDDSLIHQLFKKDMPKWVIIGPKLEPKWRPRMLEGHRKTVLSIAISCRGDRLASTSSDYTIKIWDISSGISVRTIVCDGEHEGAVFSPLDNNKLAAYHRKSISIWNVSEKNHKTLLAQDKEDLITSISLSPRRQNVLASLSYRFIELWNTDTCELIWRRPSSARHLAFSTNDDLLACYTYDSAEILGVLTGTITYHRDLKHINGTCFSSKCGLFVVLKNSERIVLWDLVKDSVIMGLQHDKQDYANYIRSLCFSADSSLLAASFRESGTWIWETASGNLIQKIAISCLSMAFSADKQQLFACSGSDQIFVLNLTGGDCIPPTNSEETNTYGHVRFSPDATKLFLENYSDEVILWDSTSQTSTAIPAGRYSVLSPDFTRLACARKSSLQIWGIDSCPPKLLFQKHFPRFFAESMSILSRDWKQMAIASGNGTINIWDTSSGKRLWKLKETAAHDMMLVFSSDGKSLAVIHFKPWKLGIWDLTSGTRTTTTFQQVTSPESFSSFVARKNRVCRLEGLPHPKQTLKSILDSTMRVLYLGLMENTSNCGFSQGNKWVISNEKRVIWLPPRYRPVSWRNWDANDRFIGIHTCQILVIEFCCNMCSAKVSNGFKEGTLCKETFTGRYNNIKEPKDISTDVLKTN